MIPLATPERVAIQRAWHARIRAALGLAATPVPVPPVALEPPPIRRDTLGRPVHQLYGRRRLTYAELQAQLRRSEGVATRPYRMDPTHSRGTSCLR